MNINKKTKAVIDDLIKHCESSVPADHDVTIIVSPRKDKKGNRSRSLLHTTAADDKVKILLRASATHLDDDRQYALFSGTLGTLLQFAKDGSEQHRASGKTLYARLLQELVHDMLGFADHYSGNNYITEGKDETDALIGKIVEERKMQN